jgi:hypothetical protein
MIMASSGVRRATEFTPQQREERALLRNRFRGASKVGVAVPCRAKGCTNSFAMMADLEGQVGVVATPRATDEERAEGFDLRLFCSKGCEQRYIKAALDNLFGSKSKFRMSI